MFSDRFFRGAMIGMLLIGAAFWTAVIVIAVKVLQHFGIL